MSNGEKDSVNAAGLKMSVKIKKSWNFLLDDLQHEWMLTENF